MRDVAPSTPLRKWFGHEPERFAEFRSRYLEELRKEPARSAVASLAELASHDDVTLVYGAKDEEHNQAAVLADEVRRLAKRRHGGREPRAHS